MLVAVDGHVAPVESALAKGIAVAGPELLDALFIPDLHPDVPGTLLPKHDRKLGEALGLVETATAAAVVRAADAARKAAEVRLIRMRLAFGIAGRGFLQLTGDVAAVQAGVSAAKAAVDHPEFLIRTEVIPLPHKDLRQWLERHLLDDLPPFDPPLEE
jgi:microcompartment protein CcmL/EutN